MAINLTSKESLSLPPQVIGKARGIIIFKISEIILNRTPNAVVVHLQWWGENPKNVQVLGPIHVTRKSGFQTVTLPYNICTSFKLFSAYLSQCEPIKADIFTAISNLKIGTSYIKVPEELYKEPQQKKAANNFSVYSEDGNFIGNINVEFEIISQEQETTSINTHDNSTKYNVYSSKITSLAGLNSKCNRKLKDPLQTTKHGFKKFNDDLYLNLQTNLTELNHNNDATSVCSKNSTDLAVTSRENVLKFLHGEDMSLESEKQALRDIRNISPADSLIALADAEHCLTKNTEWTHCPSNIGSKYDTTSNYTQRDDSILKYLDKCQLPKKASQKAQDAMESTSPIKLGRINSDSNLVKCKKSPFEKVVNHIDSIRVTIQTLTLTRAGLRIVLGLENLPLVTISPQVTFFVEYAMPTLGKQQENATNISRIRVCSKSKDGQDVPFNRQSVHRVPLADILTMVPSPVISFQIYYRKMSQRQPKQLGHCRITLNEIISSPKLHSTRKCPIITSPHEKLDKEPAQKNSRSNHKLIDAVESEMAFSDVIGFGGILAGHLTVKVELGSGLLHFGKHFLESFAANQENISLPTSELTNSESQEELLASTTCGRTAQPHFTQLKVHHHVQHPQDRCAICKDFYADKPNGQKPHEHVVFEPVPLGGGGSGGGGGRQPPKKGAGHDKQTSRTDLCNKCSMTSAKRVANKQSQSVKLSGFYVHHLVDNKDAKCALDAAVKDADDGKFVNTDLRGGKDMNFDVKDKRDHLMKKAASKKSSYFRKDRGKLVDAECELRSGEDSILLHGLLFVNEARGLEPQLLPQAYCLVNRGLSPGTGGSSKHMMCDGKYFQYLETFPLLCNKTLMERCHSGHLIIEIWLKGPGPAQKLVGVASLPLHAFFVAYHDPGMVRYLEKVKLPVISVDGWIPLLSPISGTVSGEIQALLAVGTERQLEELRTSRNLKPDLVQMMDDQPDNNSASSRQSRQSSGKKSCRHDKGGKHSKPVSCSIGVNTSPIVMRQFATSISDINSEPGSPRAEEQDPKEYTHVHTQTSIAAGADMPSANEEMENALSSRSSNAIPLKKPRSFGNLTTFVEQLMCNLPENNQFLTDFDAGGNSPTIASPAAKQPKLKQTSELLDELQRALEHVPNVQADYAVTAAETEDLRREACRGLHKTRSASPPRSHTSPSRSSTGGGKPTKSCLSNNAGDESVMDVGEFRALVEIDQALHLAMVCTHTKKCNKRSKCKSRSNSAEVMPSTYVTFSARGYPTVEAPEGPVVATGVVDSSCSPQWKEKFEVTLPSDLLTESKQLVFKIWRKSSGTSASSAMPTPNSDVVMGFAVVDLSILLSGLPTICGWFNINDINHRCNGQIKISVTPLENVQRFAADSFCCSDNDTIHSLTSSLNQDSLLLERITKSQEHFLSLLQELPTSVPAQAGGACENPDVNLNTNHETVHQSPILNMNVQNVYANGGVVVASSPRKHPDPEQSTYKNTFPEQSMLNQNAPSISAAHSYQSHCPNSYQHMHYDPSHKSGVSKSARQHQVHPNIGPNANLNMHGNLLRLNPNPILPHPDNLFNPAGLLSPGSNPGQFDEDNLNTTSLSRVLKRKFTELHEITQRLRSRLLDVTADVIDDDEFERDLNTEGDEREFDIRPEDFQSLARIVSEASPGSTDLVGRRTFEHLANDYQTMLAEKQNPPNELLHDRENNLEVLNQRKCNINNLLQKLSLLSNPSDTSRHSERHVKFNSNLDVHHKFSSNIFDMISGTDFDALRDMDDMAEESSIEANLTDSSGGQAGSPAELRDQDVQGDQEKHEPQVTEAAAAPVYVVENHSVSNVRPYNYSIDNMGKFRQSIVDSRIASTPNVIEASANAERQAGGSNLHDRAKDSVLVHRGHDQRQFKKLPSIPSAGVLRTPVDDAVSVDAEVNRGDVLAVEMDQDVDEAIANILRITERSTSKDTGLGQEEDDAGSKQSDITSETASRPDPDAAGTDSDY